MVLDTSGWIEIFTDGPLASEFRARTDAAQRIIVPTIVLYEVYKTIRRQRSEHESLTAVARLRACEVVSLDGQLALEAADISLQHSLAMADAVVYATARAHGAELLTSDRDFAELPGLVYLEKPVR